MKLLHIIFQKLSLLFSNSAFIALSGVVVGALITGYFNHKTQESILAAQHREFTDTYLLEKNKLLVKDIAIFTDCLSSIISGNITEQQLDNQIKLMFSTSLRMILTEDFNIGNKCWNLTVSLKKARKSGKIDENEFDKQITDWILAVKSELKSVDYTIDENAIERDLKQLLINNIGEKTE